MNTLAEKSNALNTLLEQGHILEAFEKYYHEEVVMQENEEMPTLGKAFNRERERHFVQGLRRFKAKLIRVARDQNHVFSEWQYDYDHQDWGPRQAYQVSVQEWQDGQVIREKFYFAN
jgi:hypothetical protein